MMRIKLLLKSRKCTRKVDNILEKIMFYQEDIKNENYFHTTLLYHYILLS